jgi:hypothetical protein
MVELEAVAVYIHDICSLRKNFRDL